MPKQVVYDIPLSAAAVELGVEHTTLAHQAREGRLDARKIGPIWLTHRAAIDRYREFHLNKPGWKSIGEAEREPARCAFPIGAGKFCLRIVRDPGNRCWTHDGQ